MRNIYAACGCVYSDCTRFDGTCTSNILLDTEDGRCCYRILLNRQEHFCPFLLLLRCVGGGLSLQQLKLKFMEGTWGDIKEATQLHALFEEAWGNEKDFVDTDLTEHRVSKSADYVPIGIQKTYPYLTYLRLLSVLLKLNCWSGCVLDCFVTVRYPCCTQPLHQLGQMFWRGVSWLMKPGSTYEDAGRFVIDRYVLVHAKDWASKFETLLLMFRKLRQLRAGKIPVSC